jgi:DNA-binding MarR family transcriptional regulator
MEENDSIDEHIADFLAAYPQIDPEVEGIVDRICKLNKYLITTLERTMSEHDLTHGEYKLLLQLLVQPGTGRISAGDLGRALMLSSGGMTNRLDRLQEAGLIKRVPDPGDRRGVLVELTAKGRKRIDEAVMRQADREAGLLAGALDSVELKELNAALRRITRSFEDRLGPAPHG